MGHEIFRRAASIFARTMANRATCAQSVFPGRRPADPAALSRRSGRQQQFGRQLGLLIVAAALLGFAGMLCGPAFAQKMTLPGQFGVSSTGAATYTVPIVAPPGTSGVVPSLALSYDSGRGNGILGLGWALEGLPVVTRCAQTQAQDQVRGTVNYDANDRFCLDGERLVAISGAYGADGTEYRTATEGFSRIYSRGSAGGGPAWFEVRTKSGQTMKFGDTADSRVLAQGKNITREWLLHQLYDVKGNYYVVNYYLDTTNGSAYPFRIDYTGNTNAGLTPANSIGFVYDSSRIDIEYAYHVDSIIKTNLRLTNIQTFSGALMVSDYRIAYGSGASGRSRVDRVTLCSAAGSCTPATSFAWQGSASLPGTSPFSAQWSGYNFIVGDWNGDGRADLILQSKGAGESIMLVSDENGQLAATGFKPTWWRADWYDIYTGDWNGTGRTGIALIAKIDLAPCYFFLSTGSAFEMMPFTPNWGGARIAVGDWNGDGKSDLFWYSPGSDAATYLFVSLGNGWFTQSGPPLAGWGTYDVYVGDWNGDGRSDIAFISKTDGHRCYFLTSNGTTFELLDFQPGWGGARLGRLERRRKD
jgi:hypothetical protein